MSFRKTKLIQQKNILLENMFLFEQGTINLPQTGTTIPSTTTTTTISKKEISKEELEKLPNCSSFDSKKFPIVSGQVQNDLVIFTHNGKNFCVKEKNK